MEEPQELLKTEKKRAPIILGISDQDSIGRNSKVLTEHLKGKKVAMVSATGYGGGVAEKLHSLVPLLNDLGIGVDWWVLSSCPNQFYKVTKSFHNCLQGQEGRLEKRDIEIYLHYNELNAFQMQDWHYDYIIIHDPQPAALIHYRGKNPGEKWIWRCHIDTSTPNMEYWNFLSRYISDYDACIYTMEDYIKENHGLQNLTFITPSIDPISYKNIPLIRAPRFRQLRHDINRYLISQVSRFDPWKDRWGPDVYRILKELRSSAGSCGSMACHEEGGSGTLRKAVEISTLNYNN